MTSTEVSIDQFFATELKVGTVRFAERVPKSDKLIRLLVDLGEESPRQLVAGIGKAYAPEELVDRQVVVVANLKPAKLMGVESRGMILAATDAEGKPILVRPHPDDDLLAPPGDPRRRRRHRLHRDGQRDGLDVGDLHSRQQAEVPEYAFRACFGKLGNGVPPRTSKE